jgi:putative DNA primase/helicase
MSDRTPDDVFDELRAEIEIPSPSDPMAVARAYIAEHYRGDTTPLLRRHNGNYYVHDGACWPEHDRDELSSSLYKWAEGACYVSEDKDGNLEHKPWAPNRRKVGDVLDALGAVVHLPSAQTPPCWIQEVAGVAATDLVVMANGILHLPTRELCAHTPNLFTHHALPFAYRPKAARPRRWISFTRELWDDDDEAIGTLHEWFGYVLSGDTSLQKMLLLVGPRRSGKGTIARVLVGLLGRHNMAAPTLSSLATNFGLAALIDKPLAVVSDARLSGRSDHSIVVERLLSISGEDHLTVDRKFRDAWTGRLPTRFMVLSNELPRLSDSSGALASRFIVERLTKSFEGAEDPELTDALLAEAPGIFNLALTALDRLRERGRFAQPESALEDVSALGDLAAPVKTFVDDRCRVDAGCTVLVDDLYTEYRRWCDGQGFEHIDVKAIFARDLHAALPQIRKQRSGTNDRVYRYSGIGLR